MKFLIIGGDSEIGRELEKYLLDINHTVYSTTKRPYTENKIFYDLLDPINIEHPEVDVAFICAAITGYDKCDADFGLAKEINVNCTTELCSKLIRNNIKVVYLSTNAVLETPLSIYGYTKARAEKNILELSNDSIIVRTTKVLTKGFPLFYNWYKDLVRHEPIKALADLYFCPVYIDYLIKSILLILDKKEKGIFQISSYPSISYYEAAQHMANTMPRSQNLIMRQTNPCLSEQETAIMNTDRFEKLTELPAPSPFVMINEWIKAQK